LNRQQPYLQFASWHFESSLQSNWYFPWPFPQCDAISDKLYWQGRSHFITMDVLESWSHLAQLNLQLLSSLWKIELSDMLRSNCKSMCYDEIFDKFLWQGRSHFMTRCYLNLGLTLLNSYLRLLSSVWEGE
jgi:hypothetical protein